MKKIIKASKSDNLVETFLRYHNDKDNWRANQNNFNKMYNILEKYDDSDREDTVDIPFSKATREDQERMINLIKPNLKVGQQGYAKKLLQDAKHTEWNDEYANGILDAFEALFTEGLLDEDDFEID